MKKTTLTILTILILTLTACSAAVNEPTSTTRSDLATGELPATTQLIIGTLELEDTDQAVTAEQAAELLPLWQTLQVLSESDTAAEQETEALIAQVQETMTAEQMQAITDMDLTREDMLAIMQEQGLAVGAGSQANSQNGNSSSSGGGGFGPGGDEFPGGAPPVGGPSGGFAPGGQNQNLSPDQIATAQAARQGGSGNFIPPGLINTLIEYLHEKADS